MQTSFFFFFSFSLVIWHFLLWLTSHSHGLSKIGPKTMTGPDFKALSGTAGPFSWN